MEQNGKQRKRRSSEEIAKSMTIRERLSDKFPDKCIKRRLLNQGTPSEKVIEYIGGDKVIERLNEVFDVRWSFFVQDKIVDIDIGQVAILGRLEVDDGRGVIIKEQWGSSAIETYSNGRIVSLGDNIKAATTDSLKKCATLLGVGLYLYDSESEKFSSPTDVLPTGKEKEEKIKEITEKVNKKATRAQVSTIIKIVKDNNLNEVAIKERYKVENFSDMSNENAAEFIIKWSELFATAPPEVVEVTKVEESNSTAK